MIKYSLALLTATAVVFSAGCDGACCGTPAPTAVILGLTAGQSVTTDSFTLSDGGSHDNNNGGSVTTRQWTVDGQDAQAGDSLAAGSHEVCLLVTDNDGLTNETCGTVIVSTGANPAPVASVNAPASCTPNSQVDISGSGTDDGSIASYSWTPSSITGESGQITCPASGSTTVCLTVTDDEGKDSTQVCKTINATNCPTLAITATKVGDPGDGTVINGVTNASTANSTELIGGGTYKFEHTWADCPNTTCTWNTLQSTVTDGDYSAKTKDCIIGGAVQSGDSIDSHVVGVDPASATINVTTCGSASDWIEIKVEVKCTGANTGTAIGYFNLDN
jgi:hypothetical protein